jgi:hypothetical protein
MDRFVIRRKRRKLDDTSPFLYKDFWGLVVPHLDWPELYALTKVSHKVRSVAMPVLLKEHATRLREHVIWKLLVYDRRVTPKTGPKYHMWHVHGIWYKSRDHPRLVNNTTIFGLLYDIFNKRCTLHLGDSRDQQFLRFCRITGIITCPPLKEWYLENK